MSKRSITVAHSPDSDDAFMFYAIAEGKIDTGDLDIGHVLEDIESLNRKALADAPYEVTAVSFHAYAYLSEKYALLPHGASIGDRYGPMVVATEPFPAERIREKLIAVPGTMTTAYLALKIFEPHFEHKVIPFDRILDAVKAGDADAGLIIHEGQLTYAEEGFQKILDLGEWWYEKTRLPLPLGGNVIRRDLGPELMTRVSKILRASIQYALDHREDALRYAMQFARAMNTELADRFVGMYVNERTLDYGEDDRRAVELLLNEGFNKGLIPSRVSVEFAG